MKKLPINLQEPFFSFFDGDLAAGEFENWVYATSGLKEHLTQSEYLSLIGLDFKTKFTKDRCKAIVDPYLDYGEYGKRKVLAVLNDLVQKNDNFYKSLASTYTLYLKGFYFLVHIALGPGLDFYDEYADNDEWEKLSDEEKNRAIDAVYELVKSNAEEVLQMIDSGEIVLTGQIDENDRYAWIGKEK